MQFRLRRVAAFVSSPIRLFGFYLVLLWIRWCLPRDAMHKHGLCRHAVSVSVTFMSCIKTNKDIFEMFSPSCIQAILVFPCQTGWRYSHGNPSNGDVECSWGRQKRHSERISLHALHTGLVVNCTSCEVWKIKPRQTVSSRALTAASVIRCSHKTTTKCLWRARRYTPHAVLYLLTLIYKN